MKSMRFAAWLICVASWAHANDPATPQFAEEVARQEAIYRSEGAQVPEGYVIDRSLLSYTQALAAEFDRALGRLRPHDRWLDIGAGRGQAILDYYTPKFDMLHFEGRDERGSKAQAVAISIEDRRTPTWQEKAATLPPDKIRYLASRRLREYSREELGKFRLITDVVGGFSYTTNLSLFMEQVLAVLEVDGDFFTVLADVSSQEGANQPFYEGSPFLTAIAGVDGSELKVCAWLKNISCVQVTCEFKPKWRPPIEAFQVHKVCNDVSVPALVPTHFEAGTPPERGFKLAN
jgi:hypothetical protein